MHPLLDIQSKNLFGWKYAYVGQGHLYYMEMNTQSEDQFNHSKPPTQEAKDTCVGASIHVGTHETNGHLKLECGSSQSSSPWLLLGPTNIYMSMEREIFRYMVLSYSAICGIFVVQINIQEWVYTNDDIFQ